MKSHLVSPSSRDVRQNVSRADRVLSSLRGLQLMARSRDEPDGRGHWIWNVPPELATPEVATIILDGGGTALMETTTSVLLEDERFEYLVDEKPEELLWRYIFNCITDRRTDHAPAFIHEHSREVRRVTCYFPIAHLDVPVEQRILETRLLPLASDEIPLQDGFFKLDESVGGVIAVPSSGTKDKFMADRAQEIAEHVLGILRVSLKSAYPSILDGQLRFKLAEPWAFSNGATGFRRSPDRPYGIEMVKDLEELGQESLLTLPFEPRNRLERTVVVAVQWINRALLTPEPMVSLLYHFFALEALLGDQSDGLKAPLLARRRAMLATAMGEGFRHPHDTYFLYESVRSAAVHGGTAAEVDGDRSQGFGLDVRKALAQFLTFARQEGFNRQSKVVAALDQHPQHPELVVWLRANGGPLWTKYFADLDRETATRSRKHS